MTFLTKYKKVFFIMHGVITSIRVNDVCLVRWLCVHHLPVWMRQAVTDFDRSCSFAVRGSIEKAASCERGSFLLL